jgi:hypothetical protein
MGVGKEQNYRRVLNSLRFPDSCKKTVYDVGEESIKPNGCKKYKHNKDVDSGSLPESVGQLSLNKSPRACIESFEKELADLKRRNDNKDLDEGDIARIDWLERQIENSLCPAKAKQAKQKNKIVIDLELIAIEAKSNGDETLQQAIQMVRIDCFDVWIHPDDRIEYTRKIDSDELKQIIKQYFQDKFGKKSVPLMENINGAINIYFKKKKAVVEEDEQELNSHYPIVKNRHQIKIKRDTERKNKKEKTRI